MLEDIKQLSKYFDHTNLKQDATQKDILTLCQEAIEYKLYAICVNPCYVLYAKDILASSDVKIATVIGFPLGANRTEVKLQEALLAVKDGADELDMVANIGLIKDHRFADVEREISQIRKNIPYNILLKVIVESSQLSDNEIVEVTKVVVNSGADYIKTSTGIFGSATENAVQLMYQISNGNIKVKASGGIKSLSDCKSMISAGASRIGSSSSVEILSNISEKK